MRTVGSVIGRRRSTSTLAAVATAAIRRSLTNEWSLRQSAKLWKVELEAVLAVRWASTCSLGRVRGCQWWRATCAAIERQTFAILSKLDLKTVDLRLEEPILVLIRLSCFGKLGYFGL